MEQEACHEEDQLIIGYQTESHRMANRAKRWLLVALYWPDREAAEQAASHAKVCQEESMLLSKEAQRLLAYYK